MTETANPPLVVIVGPTASGKSALGLRLAELFNGEIIAADARTVYKGMDIGTTKASPTDRQQIPHHLLDIATPDQVFTVADFKRVAQTAIDDISGRGELPLLVGGSGLYIYAVIYDFAFRGPRDPKLRQQLEAMTIEDLQGMIRERDIDMPINLKNRRHLVGAIEGGSVVKANKRLRSNTLVIGLDVDGEQLAANIHERTAAMIDAGLEREVGELVDLYGWGGDVLRQTIGYEEFQDYFEQKTSIQDVMQQIELHTRRLAKRQKTWFRHNKDIHWICKPEEAVDLVTTFLDN